jgi:Carboxypeptidase regulatory-like domain/TonB dependent receptor-like, beta-barrel/TonB-dependent Receptor Plug Domain
MKSLSNISGSIVLLTAVAGATIFGSVRGLVHDPEHRPVQGAQVTIRAQNSHWSQAATTSAMGEFQFNAVPAGRYLVTVSAPGFKEQSLKVTVNSGGAVNLHFPMALASVSEEVGVTATPEEVGPQSSTTVSVVHQQQIVNTPGADQSNSMAMVTDYVPGAVMVHDQLHVRGGHQMTWLLDGIPVPNTNIAGNLGPQIDPKNIDQLEAQRGGLSAEYGDRSYGVFNVITRNGFERNNQGELVLSYGSFHSTDDQLSFGSHTQRFAYYASVDGNRSDLGLETPVAKGLHDAENGLGGFASLIFNSTPSDQLRLVTSVRRDHYQIPNTYEQQSSGTRDAQAEQDDFVDFSWAHTSGDHVLLTVSPFYHFNRAHYIGGPLDLPVSPEDDRGSKYAGGVVSLAVVEGRNNAHFGVQGFTQRDNTLFDIADTLTESSLRQRTIIGGQLESAFLEDQFKAAKWLTFNGGVRLAHFSGGLSETAADPRMGAAIQVPRLGWVLRAFYGRYYQPPPLITVGGPLLNVAATQGFAFLPLRGERDQENEFGLTIPLRGWSFDVDHFHSSATNYFDHDVLGNSNIFFPITLAAARIYGWEASARSPQLARALQWHLAYSRQHAEGRGGVTGGLTDFSPSEAGYYFLDHDQRDTLSTGVQANLPWHSWANAEIAYGSGFLNGDGPAHLGDHTSFDLSLGKSFGEAWSVRLTALNLANSRYLLDNSNMFGGTHYNFPRQFAATLRYRFKY